MPRAGGESDKLGNRYEGLWTIDALLDVAENKCDSITVEPFGADAKGIEFIVKRSDGGVNFHSAKRQHSKEWSLAELTRRDANTGRSVLGDLVEKTLRDLQSKCYFVSSTGANDFRELSDRASRRLTSAEFQADLQSSSKLYGQFEKCFLPLTSQDASLAFECLRRLTPVLIDERTLLNKLEQRLGLLVYRPDGADYLESTIRVILGDFILTNLGNSIRTDAVWNHLETHGFRSRDWRIHPTIRTNIEASNNRYIDVINSELVNDSVIPRQEVSDIFGKLTDPMSSKSFLVSAHAGAGKSCVLAQVANKLMVERIPTLVVRLDRHVDASTSKDVGRNMQLPQSPVVALAGVANGGHSVLLFDQLDATSQVSGRYPHLWEVFDQMCSEATAYPNMKMVIACREFDLQHDFRLRKLRNRKDVTEIKVGLLTEAQVIEAVKSSVNLNSQQIEMLRTPLHLFLFTTAEGDLSFENFRNIGDLFRAFWDYKERCVRKRIEGNSDWMKVISRLSDEMSRRLSLYAPRNLLTEWNTTTQAMLTEHVLIADGNQIRFFHELFFDYAFARCFAVTESRLHLFLEGDSQHLFRRAQVRQVLSFLRDEDPSEYLEQLKHVLTSAKVRFHIKKMICNWLGALSIPTFAEWQLIQTLLETEELQKHLLPRIRNSLAWFKLIDRLGVIEQWLSSENDTFVTRAMWFLTYSEVQEQCSARAAELLMPYFGKSEVWDQQLCYYFQYGNSYQSRPIQTLFLRLLEIEAFEKSSEDQWWHYLDTAANDVPEFALEAILIWLDLQIATAERNVENSKKVIDDFYGDQSSGRMVKTVSEKIPHVFAQEVFPRVLRIIQLTTYPSSHGLQYDRQWGHLAQMQPFHLDDSLFQSLITALTWMAKNDQEHLKRIFANHFDSDSSSLSVIFLRTWASHPEEFAADIISFLSRDKRRLDIGYSAWTSGNPHAAISRMAISAAVPFATLSERKELEQAIDSFVPSWESDEHLGWHEKLLLEAFGIENLSENGKKRLFELRSKYINQSTEIPSSDRRSSEFVGSPIESSQASALSDDQWLEAMRRYNYGWEDRHVDAFKGSAVELSRVLQPLVRADRRRFASLALRMEDSIRSEYFEAILNGLCSSANLTKTQREDDDADLAEIETEVLMKVIRRLHRLPNRPCGREICGAFERLADRQITETDLEILRYYALEDPNPSAKENSTASYDDEDGAENAYMSGYNSVRGSAARAIQSLLFANYEHGKSFIPIIEAMATDLATPVRICVIDSLLPMLNHDRDKAVEIFIALCQNSSAIVASYPFGEFVRFASWSHYSAIRSILMNALSLKSDAAVKMAAKQICIAAFSDSQAVEDMQQVLSGRESTRIGAAEVFAINLADTEISEICHEHLSRFFDDESEKVRSTAADCFRHLDEQDLNRFEKTIRTYIESLAFPSRYDFLLMTLEESNWRLPDVILRAAEKFVSVLGTKAGDIQTAASADSPTVSKLVVRLYSESTDEEIQLKCLNVIDNMERMNFNGIEDQLGAVER